MQTFIFQMRPHSLDRQCTSPRCTAAKPKIADQRR